MKNVQNMFSLAASIRETKAKGSDQKCRTKSTEKISKPRSKQIQQNNSPKPKSKENRTLYVENKADGIRVKSTKKVKADKCTRSNKAEKKPESPSVIPQLRKSINNQIVDKQCLSKEQLQTKFSKENHADSTNNVIFVSLDFIEDCQTYKKKFMKSKCDQDLKSLRKNLRSISSYHKRYLNDTEQTQTTHLGNTFKLMKDDKNLSQRSIAKNSSPNKPEEKTLNCFVAEDAINSNEIGEDAKATSNELPVSDGLSGRWEKLSTETFSVKQPSNVDLPSKDVSTVDKKYIESLLSIANCNENKQNRHLKNNESKYSERGKGLVQFEKKKISGKTYFENKIKKQNLEKEKNETKLPEAPKKSCKVNNGSEVSQEDTVFARLVRDLTKSEMQIGRRKRKSQQSSKNLETQREQKIAHSKPEVNDNRKKRKTRNNVLKNNNEDIIEVPFPCEVSKVADVKELWRRSRKESENSVSSHSSSTIHENDEILDFKNVGLESYKILRKIVEEEIKTICKNFVEDKIENNNLKEKKNNQEIYDKVSVNLKKVCKELRNMMSENASDLFDTNGNKTEEVTNRNPTHNEHHKFSPKSEGKKEKENLLKYLAKHETKGLNPNFLSEKKDHPSEVVKKWSILHRLEQAFLALGTPTFPNHKEKDLKNLRITNAKTLKKSSEDIKYHEESLQKAKNLQKNGNNLDKQEKKNQRAATATSAKRQRDASEYLKSKVSPVRTALQSTRNAKTENISKLPLQKGKMQKTNNYGIIGSQQNRIINSSKISESEAKSKQKRGKSQNRKSNLHEGKKSPVRSHSKPKAFEFESRYSKRDVKQKKLKHNAPSKHSLHEKTKLPHGKEELSKEQPSSTSVPHSAQTENGNLERKKTFDVIPLSSKIKARKSKSCNKIEDSPDMDNTKKRFPPMTSGDSKNLSFQNFPEEQQNINKKIKTDTGKIGPKVFPKCRIPLLYDRPKTSSEKECYRWNRETFLKTASDCIYQEKKFEKTMPEEDNPGQILPENEINKGKDRVVKERSILSMRGNQNADQTRRKNILESQEETAPEEPPNKPDEELLKEDTAEIMEISLDECAEKNTANSRSTFDVTDLEENSSELLPEAVVMNMNEFEILEELTPLSSLSLCTFEQQQNFETVEVKHLKRQPIWEHDIMQYRALVKEIMSQYKRIDGFLKQNDYSQSLPNDSVCFMSEEVTSEDEFGKLSKNSEDLNIHEYRRKVLSEYQALPIIEYKTKIQEEAENNKRMEEKRKNLAFVKALKTEMDFDVKDYQPNIQKVLDSQFYVDTENILKRKEPYVKFGEKKSSLQEIVTSKNEKTIKEEERLRSTSTPRTFLLKDLVHSNSVQNFTKLGTNHQNMAVETRLLENYFV